MLRFLDPKNDFAFKRVFGTEKNKEILIGFLNDMFAGIHDTIEDVEFLKLDQDPEIAALRQSIVDVLCKDVNGKRFIIEMQKARDSSFIKRAVAYACRAYLNQRTKEDADRKTDRSNGYGNMKPVIFFAILDHELFPNKKEYLSHHKVSDVCSGENDIKDLSFSFLELKKFEKGFDEVETNIEKWTYFFKHAQSTEPQELEEIRKRDKIIGSAYDALSQSAYTPEELLEYERYEMKEDEIATRISDAKIEGLKKGKAEGKAEGLAEGLAEGKAEGLAEGLAEGKAEGERKKARETALNAIAMGLSTQQIMQLTGFSEEELRKLR